MLARRAYMRIALLLACLLGACAADPSDLSDTEDGSAQGGPQVYPSPGISIHFTIAPSATSLSGYGAIGNSAAWGTTWASNRDHHAYRNPINPFCGTPCIPTERLVVFFPGCGGQPAGYTAFMETAWHQGYHVIGLDYPDPCLSCPDDQCYSSVRQEVAFADLAGNTASLEGHPQDAIVKRLKAVLLYLESHDPYGHWGSFLDVDATAEDGLRPHYNRIVFAGHSLGAGYAAYVAKKFVVNRVVMISSPADGFDGCANDNACCRDPNSTSADWLPQHQTPSAQYYGLAHMNDFGEFNRVNRIRANWTSLAVPASHQHLSNVACSDTCYEQTHPSDGCSPHNSVALDLAYQPTWQAMLGTP